MRATPVLNGLSLSFMMLEAEYLWPFFNIMHESIKKYFGNLQLNPIFCLVEIPNERLTRNKLLLKGNFSRFFEYDIHFHNDFRDKKYLELIVP